MSAIDDYRWRLQHEADSGNDKAAIAFLEYIKGLEAEVEQLRSRAIPDERSATILDADVLFIDAAQMTYTVADTFEVLHEKVGGP